MKHLMDMRRTFPQIAGRDQIMGIGKTEKRVVRRQQLSQLSTLVSLVLRPGEEPLATVSVTLAISASVGDCMSKALLAFAAMKEVEGRVPTWDPAHLCVTFTDGATGRLAEGEPPELPQGELIRTVLRSCHPMRTGIALRPSYIESERIVAQEQVNRSRSVALWAKEISRHSQLQEHSLLVARQKEKARLEFERGVLELEAAECPAREAVVAAEEEARPPLEQLFRDVFRGYTQRLLTNLTRLRRLRCELRSDIDEATREHDGIEDDSERVERFPLEKQMPELPPPGDPLLPPFYPPCRLRPGPGKYPKPVAVDR
eukprot:Hpha_TRINITY_DN15551_c7_g6::TRINITY_DN15551_c7_g6_i1::g.106691::m.106691